MKIKNKILKKWMKYENIQQISSALKTSRHIVKRVLDEENIDYLQFFEDKVKKANENKLRELEGHRDFLVERLSKYRNCSVFVYDDLFYYFSTNKQDENGNWLVKDDFVRVVKSTYEGFIIKPIPIRSFDRLKKGADKDWTNVDYYINMLGKKISLRKTKDDESFFSIRTKFEERVIDWEKGVKEIWEKTKRSANM